MPVLDKEILHVFENLYSSSTDHGLEPSHFNVNDTLLIPPDTPLPTPQAANSDPHDISDYIPKDPTDIHIPGYNTWHQGVSLPTTRRQRLIKAQLRCMLPQMERPINQDTPLTMEQLQDHQAKDSFCAPLLQYLYTLLNMAPHYLSFKNILFVIHYYPVSSDMVSKIKLVVPKSLVHDLLLTLHTSTVGAHQGVSKMLMLTKEHFNWPKMSHDIANFIGSCDKCLLFKLNQKVESPLLTLFQLTDRSLWTS